jgi:hypothetical protein
MIQNRLITLISEVLSCKSFAMTILRLVMKQLLQSRRVIQVTAFRKMQWHLVYLAAVMLLNVGIRLLNGGHRRFLRRIYHFTFHLT